MPPPTPNSPSSLFDKNSRRRRKPLSCEPCRHSKLRCDRQVPCATCLKRGWERQCAYGPSRPTPDSATCATRRRSKHAAHVAVQESQTHQRTIPPEVVSGTRDSPEPIQQRWDKILCRPALKESTRGHSNGDSAITLSFCSSVPVRELLALLPPDNICEYLITRYFTSICPLFHILHGPTFQKQYSVYLQDPEKVDLSWLALLFAICSLTVKTISPTDPVLTGLWQPESLPQHLIFLSKQYRNAAMKSLAQDQFLVRHNLNTLEALLVIIYTISDSDGAEHGWALLGTALNIAIALRCHTNSDHANCIQRERRRRLWAGILILYTAQALLFRDTDLSFLCNMKASMPADANDSDITEETVLTRPSDLVAARPTHMSLMRFQIRLFHLSTDVCNHISGPDRTNMDAMMKLSSAISKEQGEWDSLYLVDGAPSVLDTTGYAHWCYLQTYAHQLYLLLHRPFHSHLSDQFRQESRHVCINSGLDLMDIHRQLCELPRLKCYRWLVHGTISCNALHGAVAVTSCLLDMPQSPDLVKHIAAIDATVNRLDKLRGNSPACASIYPILCHLQSRLSRDYVSDPENDRVDDWISRIDWFRPDEIGWDFWGGDLITP